MNIEGNKAHKRGARGLGLLLLAACLAVVITGGLAWQQYNAQKNALSSNDDVALSSNATNDLNAALIAAADTPTFKLFAPAWRGLGGSGNTANVKHFKYIFGGMDPTTINGMAEGTKVYKYTLGPYGVEANLPCTLDDPAGDRYKAGKCGGNPKNPEVDAQAFAKGILPNGSRYNYAVWAKKFDNWLFVPNNSKTLEFMKSEATKALKYDGNASKLYDGILSDSMGTAPLRSGYTNAKPINPDTDSVYTEQQWMDGQKEMLHAKKLGIGESKQLMINGLATGSNYFANPVGSRQLITEDVGGAMAERIFREPHATMGEAGWRSEAAWKQDVEMVAAVQEKNIPGFWWTKCWTTGNGAEERRAADEPDDGTGEEESRGGQPATCTDDGANAEAGIKQIRRYAMSSYLLGAGTKSYFNYDTNINDGNAAEWFGEDYTKAQQLGSASGSYGKSAGSTVYSRSFSKGIVVVNPTSGASTINLGSNKYTDIDGRTGVTGSYSVPAHTGNILIAERGGGDDDTDTVPPSVALTAPANNATVSGVVTVNGTASDNKAVSKVEVIVDDNVVATDTERPWFSTTWDSESVGDGDHALYVKAYDTAGNTKVSATITIKTGEGESDPSIPPPPEIREFVAIPSEIKTGESVLLKWRTNSVKSCTITPGGPINTTEKSWQTPIFTTEGDKKFDLVCANEGGRTVTKQVTVKVVKVTEDIGKPTLTASALAVKRGSSVNLSWFSKNATSCELYPGEIKDSGPGGSRVVKNIQNDTTFRVVCTNGSSKKTSDGVKVRILLQVEKPELKIITFETNKTEIETGERVTLRWHVQGARVGGCSLRPGPVSSIDNAGRWITPKLTSSVSYRLTCYDGKGKVATKTVNVVVKGTAPVPDPRPRKITPLATSTNREIVDSSTKTKVINAAVDSEVDGRVTFDPSNILDTARIDNVQYVEYLKGTESVQRVDKPPFSLDSTRLANGRYTMTERTVYKDGSQSEIARIVDISNGRSATGQWWKNAWTWLLVTLPIAVLLGIGYLIRTRKSA